MFFQKMVRVAWKTIGKPIREKDLSIRLLRGCLDVGNQKENETIGESMEVLSRHFLRANSFACQKVKTS